ncbi:MAG TPA: hypothetical protein VG389_02935 [Myxococcota bacterium]|nr:hypothetical protein [Myxococcota bacterium]
MARAGCTSEPAIACEALMSFENIVGGVLALALAAYLVCALVTRPR